MAKLLLLSKQLRSNILAGVTFLTTIVRDYNEDNKNKFECVLKYLHSKWYLS